MSVTLKQGMRRYTCLVPVVLKDTSGRLVTFEHFHMLPVTRRIERMWQDGEIQGPNGALEALVDALTYEPYAAIEEMQHPDVELFNRDFLCHLPRTMSEMLARGEYPQPAPPAPGGDDYGDGPAEPPLPPFRPPPPPAAPAAPSSAEPQPYQGPDEPGEHLDGLNFELARQGPEESLGSPARLAEADRQFQARRDGTGHAGDVAREMIAEPEAPSALKAAVARAAADPVNRAPPSRGAPAPDDWQPTPRDPFDPRPKPEPPPRLRPPTGRPARARAGADALPLDQAIPGENPLIVRDRRTGREAVYDPGPSYVPDMAVAGHEEPRRPNAFGIAGLEP